MMINETNIVVVLDSLNSSVEMAAESDQTEVNFDVVVDIITTSPDVVEALAVEENEMV